MNQALFLDRDGTLIVDKNYLADPAGVELFPGVSEGLRRAKELGFGLFLFTNQSGIGRGFFTIDDARRVNARMEELIGLPPPLFDDICIAPETPDQPMIYRKPSPRFILETLARRKLAPSRCTLVGDSAGDIGAGLAASLNVAVVRTGRVDPSTLAIVAERRIPVFDTFADFARTLG